MDDAPPLVGRLLVAAAELGDPNFRRTVVLLLDHGDHGALGVVLDRPLPVPVQAVLPGWQEPASPPGTVFQGGPVGLDGALGVATLAGDGPPPDGVTRVTGPFGIVDLDAEPSSVSGAVTGLRVFAGHAGWGEGQLEAEVEDGDWYVVPAEPGDLLDPAPSTLWRRVLRRQGGDLAVVSTFAVDPSMN
jgi:putative transcriptional regulator